MFQTVIVFIVADFALSFYSSDADPVVLSEYIQALLKHDVSLEELKKLCREQLEDFLGSGQPSPTYSVGSFADLSRLRSALGHRDIFLHFEAILSHHDSTCSGKCSCCIYNERWPEPQEASRVQ
jgi:hypothetical protein